MSDFAILFELQGYAPFLLMGISLTILKFVASFIYFLVIFAGE